jgi:uncharacterized oligopeptide transporter (OPT) family protein
MGLAAIVMFIDLVASQSKQGLRVPVLSVALGLYLPLELSFPIFFGMCSNKEFFANEVKVVSLPGWVQKPSNGLNVLIVK